MITKEFLQSQLRDSETWEPIYCQIVNLLEFNDRIRLSEVSEIADKTKNSVEDVFLVLQLLTVSPEPIRMVYRKFEDGKSKEIDKSDINEMLSNWHRNKTVTDEEWKAFSSSIEVSWEKGKNERYDC